MATEFKLDYTAQEINNKLGEVDRLSEEIVDLTAKGNYISIPKTIYIVVGKEFRMYYNNVISRTDCRLWVGATSGAEVQRYADYLSITANQETTTNIPWKLYDEKFNVLENGLIEINAVSDKPKAEKVIVIGDSLVEGGNATRQKLKDNFESAGGSITFLGTQGTSPLFHEGRGGWKAKHYCTAASYGSVTNPFYNNGFDFSYYMEQQGYDNVDVVTINLGINDIFSQTYEDFTSVESLTYMQDMVDSILAYDSNIKVIVNLITPPTSDADLFTGDYGTGQIDFVYLANTIKFAKHTRERFQSNAYVTLCPTNCVLDTATDFVNGVHLNTSGYEKLGQVIYETMNGILDTPLSPYNNLVPTSIDTDGSIYNDTGYMAGYRLSSSGSTKAQTTGYPYVTGFMPAKAGDVVRIAGIQWYVENSGINYICAYDSEFNFVGGVTAGGTKYGGFLNDAPTFDYTAELTTCMLPSGLTDIAYIRVNWVGAAGITYDPTLAIITVNEEITE